MGHRILPKHLKPKNNIIAQKYTLASILVFVFAVSGGFSLGFSQNKIADATAVSYKPKGYIMPVSGLITQGWNGAFSHKDTLAIDISGPNFTGTPIVAAKTGKVVRSANDGLHNAGYGNFVVIEQDEGGFAYYAHLSKTIVRDGEMVKQGQLIGNAGNTGDSTNPHLHFEVKKRIRGAETLPFYFVNCNECILETGKIYNANSNGAITPPRPILPNCDNLFAQKWKMGQKGQEVRDLQNCLRERNLFAHPTITGNVGNITIDGLSKIKKGQDLCELLYQRTWRIGQNSQVSSCLKSVNLVKKINTKIDAPTLQALKKLTPELVAKSNI